jgi:hypothetical protein
MHLSKTELYWSPDSENEDRLSRLISHLFRSQSLYPVFGGNASTQLNLRQSRQHIELKELPHVLIVPSLLQPAIRVSGFLCIFMLLLLQVVDKCVCVNPGRLVRGNALGTLARIDIDTASAVANAGDAFHQSVASFSRVDILEMTL